MYDKGYGLIDSGGKVLNYHFRDFFTNKNTYDQKEIFFRVLENTFQRYSHSKFSLYYLLENPELGFSPKNCMERPFNIFPLTDKQRCKFSYNNYIARAGEYRNKIYEIAQKYTNITILDPKDLYCDNLFCYAIKDDKMLYADDHHSIDGSKIQAKYLMKDIFK